MLMKLTNGPRKFIFNQVWFYIVVIQYPKAEKQALKEHIKAKR